MTGHGADCQHRAVEARTLEAFEAYIREAEAAMEPSLQGRGAFLWSDTDPQIAQQVRHGDIAAQLWSGDASIKVPNGLIHDWIAAALVRVPPSPTPLP